MKINNIVYYISTALASFPLLMGAGNYIFNNEMIQGAFTSLGFPIWLIYPMAIAKILGVAAIWIPAVPKWLREWAYAGIFFNVILAAGAHMAVSDGSQGFAIIALVMVIVSRYTLSRKEGGMPTI